MVCNQYALPSLPTIYNALLTTRMLDIKPIQPYLQFQITGLHQGQISIFFTLNACYFSFHQVC